MRDESRGWAVAEKKKTMSLRLEREVQNHLRVTTRPLGLPCLQKPIVKMLGEMRLQGGSGLEGGKDPHPQDFSLTKKTARFTVRPSSVLTTL